MNTRHMHEPGLICAEEEPYEHYDDFLRRCWHIHHLVGDLWEGTAAASPGRLAYRS